MTTLDKLLMFAGDKAHQLAQVGGSGGGTGAQELEVRLRKLSTEDARAVEAGVRAYGQVLNGGAAEVTIVQIYGNSLRRVTAEGSDEGYYEEKTLIESVIADDAYKRFGLKASLSSEVRLADDGDALGSKIQQADAKAKTRTRDGVAAEVPIAPVGIRPGGSAGGRMFRGYSIEAAAVTADPRTHHDRLRPPAAVASVRRRSRVSYLLWVFRVDVTTVNGEQVEVELELDARAAATFFRCGETAKRTRQPDEDIGERRDELAERCRVFRERLRGLLGMLDAYAQIGLRDMSELCRYMGDIWYLGGEAVAGHADEVLGMQSYGRLRVAGRPEAGARFPGAMPANLRRADFDMLREGDYLVTEKTNGMRYLLAVAAGMCYLVDRGSRVISVPIPRMQAVFAPTDDVFSLFDCEMVRDTQARRVVLLIFDVLVCLSVEHHGRSFRVRRHVMDLAARALDTHPRDDPSHIHVYFKTFFEPCDIQRLCAMRQPYQHHKASEHESVVNEYANPACVSMGPRGEAHLTDGLILTPNRPYVASSDRWLFKLKPGEWTIDLCILGFGQQFQSQSQGQGQTALTLVAKVSDKGRPVPTPVPIRVDPVCAARLAAAVSWTDELGQKGPSTLANSFIAEFLIPPTFGGDNICHFVCLRPDKSEPNSLYVFEDTLDAAIENIVPSDIAAILAPAH